jgi:hypothetical protein
MKIPVRFLRPFPILAAVAMAFAAPLQAKPLKVFILVGQSNMEGHAQTRTFPAIAKDPATADLYKKMVDAEGKPVVCEDVWIAYSYGDFSGNPVGKRSGQLTAGFGSQHHVGTGKIGPEFTFGITMRELLGEPVLLIKDAWAARACWSISARPAPGNRRRKGEGEGGEVLPPGDRSREGSPGGSEEGLSGGMMQRRASSWPASCGSRASTTWWAPYPAVDPSKGKKGIKDYSEYSRLLACLIRDVRKDLSAPNLPFVIGVLGVGGAEAGEGTAAFRESMAAPGRMEEFKGSVTNVFTHEYWPAELDAVQAKANTVKSGFAARDKEIKELQKSGGVWKQKAADLEAEKRKKIEEALTADELFLLDNGISNQGYHYLGSAKFFARIGQAFAEAWMGLNRNAGKK